MRTFVAAPKLEGKYPGIVFYSDIFQLTGPMIRATQRLAGYGFVVAAPEIYHRIEPAGTVIPFDDEGRIRGLAGAAQTPVADFDADCRAVLRALREGSLARADSASAGIFLIEQLFSQTSWRPLVSTEPGFTTASLGRTKTPVHLKELRRFEGSCCWSSAHLTRTCPRKAARR